MGKKSHKSMPFMCGACKQGFNSKRGVTDHIRNVHCKAVRIGIYRCIERIDGSFDRGEPSFADRSIEAQIAQNSGLPTDDAWLLGE